MIQSRQFECGIKPAAYATPSNEFTASALQSDDVGNMGDGRCPAVGDDCDGAEEASSCMQVDGQQIPAEFTYSVTWRETTVPFEKRMDKYRRYQFLPQHLEVQPSVGCAGQGSSCRSVTRCKV